jgi:hypothetical protein
MIRALVQLTDEQWTDARELARLEGLSFAAFVRHAIDARLARSESARFTVKQQALAAVDSFEPYDRDRAGDGEGPGSGVGESGADDPASRGRSVPRYWLEQ